MERDTFAFQVYDCIRRRISEVRECVDEICARDFKLKYCLEVYKHLASLRSGLDFTTQCRDVEAEQDATICAEMERFGVSYETFCDKRFTLTALTEKASTQQGREELFHAMNDMMDFFDDWKAALHRIVHHQSKMARTAFQIERLRNGADDACVEEFIRHREMELFDEQELLNLRDFGSGTA